MGQRESAIRELQYRMWNVPGVGLVLRNTSQEPAVSDMPFIGIFELTDRIVEAGRRGGGVLPVYKREVDLVLEIFIAGSTEADASAELADFVSKVRAKLYEGGVTLGKRCSYITETGMSKVLRPPVGGNIAGIGISLTMTYVDDVSAL